MELIPIPADGQTGFVDGKFSEMIRDVVAATVEMYLRTGYSEPWTGYLAVEDGHCLGTCGFKSPPRRGQIEIAYFTFPEYERRGVATAMAKHLIKIARETDPCLTIIGQTLPVDNASTAILKKLGFHFSGERDHPEDGRVWEWHLQDEVTNDGN